MNGVVAILGRELRLAFRQSTDTMMVIAFVVIAVVLTALVGGERNEPPRGMEPAHSVQTPDPWEALCPPPIHIARVVGDREEVQGSRTPRIAVRLVQGPVVEGKAK